MSDKIRAALDKLDPKNDNHWTQDGSPRIDTVKLLAGDQNITREQILSAAPQFNRQNLASAPEVPQGDPKQAPASSAEAPAAGASTTAVHGTVAGTGVVTDPSQSSIPVLGVDATTEDLRGEEGVDYHAGVDATGRPTGVILEGIVPNGTNEIDELQERADNGELDPDLTQQAADAAQKRVDDALQDLEDARAELETAQNELAFATDSGRESNPNAISEYLEAQKKRQEQRIAARQQLNDLGVDVRKLAKDASPSPLDQSIAARNRANRGKPGQS